MSLSRELLFFFSALGAFNGLLFGLYFLLVAKPPSLSRKLFGGFVLALSIRVGKSVFLFFNQGLAREYLQFGLTACLFIGPLLYFFVRSVNEEDQSKLRKQLTLHLGALVLIALVGGTLYPYRTYPAVWRGYLISGIYLVWGVYTVAALYAARPQFKRLFSAAPARVGDRMIVFTTVGTFIVLACYNLTSFTSYITGALAFSLLLYSTWAATRFPKREPLQAPSAALTEEPPVAEPRAPLLDPDRREALIRKLDLVMAEDRLFVNSNLKLAELATAIGATPHQLSYLLNSVLGTKFHHYLNERRVALAKELITTQDHLGLEAIGQACGFNSRSTFYKAFKKMTGTTPSKYREDAALSN